MSGVAKTTIWLMVATILSKILGFARSLVLASVYGADMYSDAYLIAMNIPTVVVAIIGAAIITTFIPIYSSASTELGEKAALKYTNNILNIVMLVCMALTIISLIFIDPLVNLFAFGFDEQTFKLAVEFTRILIVSVLFSGISYIMTAYLQVKNKFTIVGLMTIPRNIIIIISIILSSRFGPYIMIYGTLLGLLADVIYMYPFMVKNGYKYKLYINIKDTYIKKTIWLLAPILIGVAVNQVNTMVDRSLASTLVEGSISSLSYADKLNAFVMAIFIASVSSVVYPMLSKLSSEDNKQKFVDIIANSINTIVIFIIPISVGAIVLSTPIVKLLFQRGKFDDVATNMTAIALSMYSIGMLAIGLRDILTRVFYSLQDTKTPMINSCIAMSINIVLNLILLKKYQHAGLALATSLSAIICVVLLFLNLSRKIGYFGQGKIFKTMMKSAIASMIMAIVTKISYSIIISGGSGSIIEIGALFGAIIIGAIVYGLMIMILRVEEINIVIDKVKLKLKK